ncbi:MAG TPA: hypothetical protein VKH42_17545 [Vicinamibacterales bacterium]|nr:hypothetical protein [Vicinamibacterales bacterium]
MKTVLYWIPRALGIGFVALTMLLATDAEPNIVAVVMHLIPTAIAAGLLALAWSWEAFGGLLYVAAGAAYTAWAVVGLRPLSWVAVIAAPLAAAGALFLIDARVRSRRPVD